MDISCEVWTMQPTLLYFFNDFTGKLMTYVENKRSGKAQSERQTYNNKKKHTLVFQHFKATLQVFRYTNTKTWWSTLCIHCSKIITNTFSHGTDEPCTELSTVFDWICALQVSIIIIITSKSTEGFREVHCTLTITPHVHENSLSWSCINIHRFFCSFFLNFILFWTKLDFFSSSFFCPTFTLTKSTKSALLSEISVTWKMGIRNMQVRWPTFCAKGRITKCSITIHTIQK